MSEKSSKPRWSRAEKGLLITPIFILLCYFSLTKHQAFKRWQLILPSRIIPIEGQGYLMIRSLDKARHILLTRENQRFYYIYDLQKGALQHTIPLEAKAESKQWGFRFWGLWGVVFTPDGKSVVIDPDSFASVWDLKTNTKRRKLPVQGAYMTFSPDGKLLATNTGDVCNFQTGALIRHLLKRGEGGETNPAFSKDGRLLALRGPYDWRKNAKNTGNILIFDTTNWKLKRTISASAGKDFFFSPDGKRIFCQEILWSRSVGLSQGNISAFDLTTGQVLWRSPLSSSDMAVSPDGKWMALTRGYSQIALVDTKTGKLTATLNKQISSSQQARLSGGVKFTPNSKQLISSYEDGIYIWDMAEINARFANAGRN